jgi:hypothetical protein
MMEDVLMLVGVGVVVVVVVVVVGQILRMKCRMMMRSMKESSMSMWSVGVVVGTAALPHWTQQ